MSLFISRTFRARAWGREAAPVPSGKVTVTGALEARELGAELRLAPIEPSEGDSSPTAGELAALALLDDLYQRVLDQHLERRDGTLLSRVLAVLRAQMGLDLLDRLLVEFAEEYLGARLAGLSLQVDGSKLGKNPDLGRTQVLKEMLVFWLLHSNPAAQPIVEQIHSAPLLEVPAFREVVDLMSAILDREPGYVVEGASLWELLIRPQRLSPESLSGQLSLFREIWSDALGELSDRMDSFLGMMSEERAPRFSPGPGPPAEVPTYQHLADDVRFSTDQDWMSGLVLVAKHTLVWLHQLSTAHGRPIERLDQIPDTELERLAALGFDGLWLIGLWQRSPASKRIKQLCGNPEAASSAYSLTRYEVAANLGGEDALDDLRNRAARFGIRLAADMVPNHTGLDSDWMMDRPDWFIAQDRCPFPAYSFHGEDLSSRPEIGIYLEDHYFDRSDAAVVFKRVDRRSGQESYVYHGNDGTSTPWNDTAQLDYLNPEVWSVVIDTIVAVARRFPVIRFDAAMTLTRKHFHRLWYPAPGTAGDIPSRAEHGIATDRFFELLPEEFWRQVVDRIAQEAPDTLLLAEAFWLMEGFFVRTLGMHRVYNSAFMNMLRDGETQKFRQLIQETLVFDPGILKRYVNFMSNPDELSAVEQFGDGDRYFGTCVVMSTLPGLPMFGHGQVEGWRERYGMEYRRAYHEEPVREDLIQRHLRQIAPLLHSREVFADAESFRLYPLVSGDRVVQEDVLAYSNRKGDRVALVLFNNSNYRQRGCLKTSVPFRANPDSQDGDTSTSEVGEALRMSPTGYWAMRDSISGSEFLFDSREVMEDGLEVELPPWGYRVLTDLERVDLDAGLADQMRRRTGLQGVSSLTEVRKDLELEPLRQSLVAAIDEGDLRRLIDRPGGLAGLEEADELFHALRAPIEALALELDLEPSEYTDRLLGWVELGEVARRLAASKTAALGRAGSGLRRILERTPEIHGSLYCWVLMTVVEDAVRLGGSVDETTDWRLESKLLQKLIAAGGEPDATRRHLAVLKQALRQGWGRDPLPPPEGLELQRQILSDAELRRTLGVNEFEGREYVSREVLEALIEVRLLLETHAWTSRLESAPEATEAISEWWRVLDRLAADAEAAAYQTDRLGVALSEAAEGPTSGE